jgi:hypothetical protein
MSTFSDVSTSANFPLMNQPSVPASVETGMGVGLYGYSLETGTSEPSIRKESRAVQRQERHSTKRPTTHDRQALAEHLAEALSQATNLESAINSEDVFEASIVGLDLRESLRRLWRLRNIRSIDWATIVNKIQVAISNLKFEQFTPEMVTAIRMVVESHLRPDVDNEDVRAVTVLFERAGLHPWKAISNGLETNGR